MSHSQASYRSDEHRSADRVGDPARTRHPMIFPAVAGSAIVAVLLMYVLESAFN